MRNFKKLGFPISVVLDEGRPTLRNSLMKLRAGCLFFLRCFCLGFLVVCLLMWFIVRRLPLVDRMVGVGGNLKCCLFLGFMVLLAFCLVLRILVFGLRGCLIFTLP